MISIVMAYYNRKGLLDKTLESIDKSRVKDYELIIVDDASDEPLVCECARVFRVEPEDKWYHNPCIPYNFGFKQAVGDVVIIQNPECYHVGDVLAYVEENIRPRLYISFGCYSISKEETNAFARGMFPTIADRTFSAQSRNGWYNHSIHRPKAYHFCTAITKTDLDKIGGFDERYANGVAFDDDALVRSIRQEQIEIQIINDPYVIHQYHHHFTYEDPKIWKPLHTINQNIFNGRDGVSMRGDGVSRRRGGVSRRRDEMARRMNEALQRRAGRNPRHR